MSQQTSSERSPKLKETNEQKALPVLPVRDTVLFPHAVLPLTVGRESSVQLINSLGEDKTIIVVAQREARVDAPQPSDLYTVGTSAVVHKVVKMPNQSLFVFAEGLERIKLGEFTQLTPFMNAHYSILPESATPVATSQIEALQRNVLTLFQQIVAGSPTLSEELSTVAMNIDEPGRLVDFITSSLPSLSTPVKEDTLETPDVHVRLEKSNQHLAKEREKAQDRTLAYMSIPRLKPTMKGPILCLVGPPGVGKTSLGKSIARALGRKFTPLSLGGVHDEAEIRGHRRTYIGALPGQIIQGIRRAETKDPVFMLDEVDKVGRDFRGDPASALLEALDPEQNVTFRDNYLDVTFALSKVLFITTANMLDPVAEPLRDRMEIIELQGYTEAEKVHIAFQYLVPRQIEENGITKEQIDFPEEAIQHIIRHYTHEAGVRNLERTIGTICRKQARRLAEGKTEPLVVTKEVVQEFLGGMKIRTEGEIAERTKRAGVAVGLAWTPAGGDVLVIEANRMKGKGNFTMSGQIGQVMQESMQAALTWVRSNADCLGVAEDFFASHDIHIHVPAGAIPKDGPSAGVTMATALVSLLTKHRITPLIAMTGEITLSGNVLPVGGIKEKVLAAKRAGVRDVILPAENKMNVEEDLTPEQLENLTVHYVKTIDEALQVSLPAVADSTAAKILQPEPVHDRVLTTQA